MRLILLFVLFSLTVQANLGSFYKEGGFTYPETNKPYAGNLDVINNDWNKDAVEFNKDYVDDPFRANIDSLPLIVGKNIAIRVNGVALQRCDESSSMRRI